MAPLSVLGRTSIVGSADGMLPRKGWSETGHVIGERICASGRGPQGGSHSVRSRVQRSVGVA